MRHGYGSGFKTSFYLTGTGMLLTLRSGSFLPITLEQMTRDQGVLLSDKTTPCVSAWPPSDLNTTELSHSASEPSHQQCIVYVLGIEINTASFAMYSFSISVLIQSLIIVSISAAADHGVYRKLFLLTFAVTGAISMMLFLPLLPRFYLLAAALSIIANTCFGGSFVLLNSFLPLLVRNHPSILFPNADNPRHTQEPQLDNQGCPVNTSHAPQEEASTSRNLEDTASPNSSTSSVSAELQLSSKISSNGIGIGYIAAVFVQIICIFLVVLTHSTTFSLRLVLSLIGLWWLVFTIPSAVWLRPRPGPPLPSSISKGKRFLWVEYVCFAWKSLGSTALRARQLKDMVLFLAAWFLLSDGIATVSGTAVLFAKTQLNMGLAALGMINVITMIFGVCGAFCWGYVSRLFNLSPSQTIIACICLFELVPLYGLLGLVPAIQRLGVFGLQQPWEMYPVGAIYGLVIGGLSSYCRSLFGELIPHGFEASFYALYAITDKGSSFFGPAIVGAITDRYGEIRPAFLFLALLILVPLPLMLAVDVNRGKRDASLLAKALEQSESQSDSAPASYGTISP